jgi:NAD(P)H-hydrate epimerase
MPIPILTVSQMREWENATWAAGRSEADVISRVGYIVAQRAKQMTRPGDLIVVLAGKGHNGDDARQASRNFSDREVYLINVTEPEVSVKEFLSQLQLDPALILDGLFGVGLNRPLTGEWAKMVDKINSARVPILSIDVPSGLDAYTGEAQGTAIRATITLTLGAPKRGLLASTAWPHVGRLELAADIGLIPRTLASDLQWTVREDFSDYPPARPIAGHKGTFGHAVLFAGSVGYHGAAVLAARSALRARPGLVTVFTSEEAYIPVASQLQAAMVHPWQPGRELPDSATSVLFGPGLASPRVPAEMKSHLARLWNESPLPVLVDASGLDWLPQGAVKAGALRVITPHPGEAARLLKSRLNSVQNDRVRAVRDLSKLHGDCWIALKGYQTLIGRSSGETFVNSSGNPLLAQGGSGDVLAGYLIGLMAQPALQSDWLTTLRYAVWQHGASADHLSLRQRNWVIEDLIDTLGNVPDSL